MAKSVNKVILLGNVGKDPEIKSTPGGTMVANWTLATSDRQKDQQGNWLDRTEWHNLVAFNRTAEIVRDYVQKGSKVYIEGKIQTRSWADKQSGEKRYRTEIIVNDISLLSGRDDQGSGNHQNSNYGSENARSQSVNGRGGYGSSASTASEPWDSSEISDDDIPF
jgi:single-strand DNA-binding protein